MGPMLDDPPHRRRIIDCLTALRRDPADLRYEVLQGGISGAATYRVWLGAEELILKIADPAGPAGVLQRARREMHFYRDLADRVPLRVPVLLGMAPDSSAPWLALRAYQPPPPIKTWSQQQYTELAHQLGRFHAAFWNSTPSLSNLSWLRNHGHIANAETIRQAVASWQALMRQGTLTPHDLSWIGDTMSRIDRLEAVHRDFPLTLIHGDCHHGNLLVDDSRQWLWTDWQEVGFGRGPEDLSFLFQRARSAGGDVPEDEAIRAYHWGLEDALGQTVNLQRVAQVVDASELRMLLLLWPPFLSDLSTVQLSAIVCRLRDLARKLGVGLSA